MIFIISDDIAIAENIQDSLSLVGLNDVMIKPNHYFNQSEVENGIDLIIYWNSFDKDLERIRWFLIANGLDTIPILLFTETEKKSVDANCIYIITPFEVDTLTSHVKYLIKHKKEDH